MNSLLPESALRRILPNLDILSQRGLVAQLEEDLHGSLASFADHARAKVRARQHRAHGLVGAYAVLLRGNRQYPNLRQGAVSSGDGSHLS